MSAEEFRQTLRALASFALLVLIVLGFFLGMDYVDSMLAP